MTAGPCYLRAPGAGPTVIAFVLRHIPAKRDPEESMAE